MKKNTLRKLTLSAVTMGVAALSLTSTTYAWFTTNGEATASGVKGTVKSADTLMLIKSPTGWNGSKPIYNGTYKWDNNTMTTVESTNAQAATFQTSTVLVNESGNGDTRNTLSPVSIKDSEVDSTNGTFVFKKLDGRSSGNSGPFDIENSSATSSDYLHYQVVISISGLANGQSYDVTMTLPELNKETVTQYLLVDAGIGDNGATAGKTIKVGIADALSLGIKNTILSGNNIDTTYGVTTGGTVSKVTNDASGFYHAKTETTELYASTDTYDSTASLTGTAAEYYKKVYGLNTFAKYNDYENLYTTGEGNTFSSWNTTAKKLYTITGTVDNDSFVCVTDLYFFIDGWDNQCFNAIGGLDLFNEKEDSKNIITFACNPSGN